MNKKRILVLVLLLVLIGSVTAYFVFNNIKEEKRRKEKIEHENEVANHISDYSITNKETNLYIFKDNEKVEYGKIGKNVKIKLTDIKTDYYKIDGLDAYIYYLDVDKTDKFEYSNRYKKYIPFNYNIKTKDSTTFVDSDGNLVYTINTAVDLPVIIKENDRFGVEYNNQLLYIEGNETNVLYEKHNTDLGNKPKIKTLTYHFIYNSHGEDCYDSICLPLDTFEEHLKYLSENNYLTLTMEELELYMDGALRIPDKSIVLTIDDGTRLHPDTLKLLEKYDAYATLFVITSVVDTEMYQSDHLALESHTHNMHNQYECPGYGLQGGGILCLSEEHIQNDLKTSQEMLGGSKYFAYPFFDVNEYAIRMLKEAGFHMAFIGEWDTKGYSTPGITDKFRMRRLSIFSDADLNTFINEYLR